MIFTDADVQKLDLTSASGVQKLVEIHLCGHAGCADLIASDSRLLNDYVAKAADAGVTFRQLNELLLVLNQDRLSRAFFDFFFGEKSTPLSMDELRKGVIKFKGFAMVCFGNFRFAYRHLSQISDAVVLRDELGAHCNECDHIEKTYKDRADKILDISFISRENTWFVGEITGGILEKEVKNFETHRKDNPDLEDDDDAVAFAKRLGEMDDKFQTVQETALRNTDVYLTWDYLDVYVATSMRNQWEYEETFDFTHRVFGHPSLKELRLRYFDPTQSKCKFTRDKGLLEGLMLKRASCTIYMAQESDTLGKDSELANTLAQGKPVVAYIPRIDPKEYAEIVAKRPLSYARLRLLHLQAAGTVDEVDGLMEITQEFLKDFLQHRAAQPCELWDEKDTSSFKKVKAYWPELCQKLAQAERIAFDKRARVLMQYHPLGMQMDLQTGVANGVLVVRSADEAARLLRSILTNTAEFDIKYEPAGSILVERNSGSVFRAVTANEKLTNSFWNLWTGSETGKSARWRN